jgi:hypothetical protein
MRALLLLGVVVGVLACDPRVGVYLQQRLVSAPHERCMSSGLASSTLVDRVVRDDSLGRRYTVYLTDSAEKGLPAHWVQVEWQPTAMESPQLKISVLMVGTTFTLARATTRRFSSIGLQLAEAIREACHVPASEVTCEISGFGPSRRCAPAG